MPESECLLLIKSKVVKLLLTYFGPFVTVEFGDFKECRCYNETGPHIGAVYFIWGL